MIEDDDVEVSEGGEPGTDDTTAEKPTHTMQDAVEPRGKAKTFMAQSGIEDSPPMPKKVRFTTLKSTPTDINPFACDAGRITRFRRSVPD